MADAVGASRDAIHRAWPDENGDAWAQEATGVVNQALQIQTVCSGMPGMIRTFLEAIGVIDRRYRTYRDTINEAVDTARNYGIKCTLVDGTLTSDMPIYSMLNDPPALPSASPWWVDRGSRPVGRPVCEYIDPVDAARLGPFAVTPESTEVVLDAALAGIGRLWDDRDEAENTLADGLSGALPDRWAAQKATFAQIGATSPAEMTPGAYAKAMAAKAKAAVKDGTLTDAEITELGDFLTTYDTNQAVMSKFYQDLGGAGTGDLIEGLEGALNDSHRDRGLTWQEIVGFAGQVRAGLAVASQGWDANYGQLFVEELYAGGGQLAVAFLFDGPPYMGEGLAVAAADQTDVWERQDGHSSTGYSDLIQRDSGHGAYDAAGRTFETLGQYPAGAAAFLDDPDHGGDRIEYWYADRDWALNGEGFEGPAILFNATQHTPLDANDPDAVKRELERRARLTTQVVNALYVNPSFLSENVSDAASLQLAEAIAAQYMAINEALTGLSDVTKADREQGYQYMDVPYGEGQFPVPLIDADALKKLFGVVGDDPSGAVVLGLATEAYRAGLGAAAQASGVPVDDQIQGVAQRIANAQAMFDGSVNAATLEEARRLDEDVKKEIAAMVAMGVIMTAPVTLGTGVVGVLVVPWGAAAVVTAAAGGATAYLEDRFAVHSPDAVEAVQASEDQQRDYARMIIADSTAQLLGLTVPPVPTPPPGGATSPDYGEYLGSVDAWVEENFDAINQAAHGAGLATTMDLHELYKNYENFAWATGAPEATDE